MVSFESEVLDYIRGFKTLMTKLPSIEGKTFTEETIWLDFKQYENCKFIKCVIMIEYGLFKLKHNGFELCSFKSSAGTPAHTILFLDRIIKDSAMLDKNK